jgi:ABC-type multidrug transport system fused ATPase/permease subunit
MTEATIFRKLLARRGTCIAITHRFHLAVKSDIIFFMSKGKLVEQGSHAQLMAKPDGEYRKMYVGSIVALLSD